jgi:lipopolysaccharide export system permease protein
MFGTVLVMFLFLFQFLLKSIDQLVGKGLSEWVIIQLIVLNLSWMLVLAVPMGVLFSTVMAFGNMSSVHEVTIIKSSGGSLIRMMKPIIVSSMLLTLLLFWFNDEILPEANHQAKVLMMDIRRKKPTFSMESGQFSQQLDGYTILARQVDSLSGMMRAVTIYDNRSSASENIVTADTGIASFSADMSKLILDLYHGEIHQLIPNEVNNYRKVNFEKYKIFINASGFNLERSDKEDINRGDREMHIRDMRKIVNESKQKRKKYFNNLDSQLVKHYNYLIGKSEELANNPSNNRFMKDEETLEGAMRAVQRRASFFKSSISSDLMRIEDYELTARQYEVEIQKKYAIPFACFVFILVGCPLGIMTKGGNFGISAAISIGFYIFYWACLIGGEKLADRGILDPVLSMWMGNIAVFIMGIILVVKVNNESMRIPGLNFIKKLIAKYHSNKLEK